MSRHVAEINIRDEATGTDVHLIAEKLRESYDVHFELSIGKMYVVADE